jgi:hypothetical protein
VAGASALEFKPVGKSLALPPACHEKARILPAKTGCLPAPKSAPETREQMNAPTKQRLMTAGITAALAVAFVWTCFARYSVTRRNAALQWRVGEVLAEQSVRLLGKDGRIVSIAMDTRDRPQLNLQLEAFKAALRRLGDYELRECDLDSRDCVSGTGLSGRSYVRTVKQHPNADVFVSFIGIPKLTREDIAELGIKPRLVAESSSADNLSALFENQLIEVAVVPRFELPTHRSTSQYTPQDRFTERFEIVTADSAILPPRPK